MLVKEATRYLAASAVAFVVDLGLFSGLIRLGGVSYLYAAPAAFSVGIALMYFVCTRWVFEQRRLTDQHTEFGVFVAFSLLGLVLNQVTIWLAVEMVRLPYEAAKTFAAGFVFAFNFISRKLVLFTHFGSRS